MATDPFRPLDEDALTQAHDLIFKARHGALGVLLNGEPFVSRVALAPTKDGLLTLISDLSPHTTALREHARASLMVGEPGKGDPLAHPRLTLSVDAAFVDKDQVRESYLGKQPKAQLYFGFSDFHVVRLDPTGGHLNAGFGKAFRLTADDLSF
jgi:putative heme iron utilization protein